MINMSNINEMETMIKNVSHVKKICGQIFIDWQSLHVICNDPGSPEDFNKSRNMFEMNIRIYAMLELHKTILEIATAHGIDVSSIHMQKKYYIFAMIGEQSIFQYANGHCNYIKAIKKQQYCMRNLNLKGQ